MRRYLFRLNWIRSWFPPPTSSLSPLNFLATCHCWTLKEEQVNYQAESGHRCRRSSGDTIKEDPIRVVRHVWQCWGMVLWGLEGVYLIRGGRHAGEELSIGRWMALEWAGPLSSPSNWNLNRWSAGSKSRRRGEAARRVFFRHYSKSELTRSQRWRSPCSFVVLPLPYVDQLLRFPFFHNVKHYRDPLWLLPFCAELS